MVLSLAHLPPSPATCHCGRGLRIAWLRGSNQFTGFVVCSGCDRDSSLCNCLPSLQWDRGVDSVAAL